MDNPFWNGWSSIAHTVISGIAGYIFLVILLRLSGKRTLSKFNAFDFVVTIAFGSILASMLLNTSVSIAQGLLAIFMLIMMQYLLTWFAARSERFTHLIKSQPTLLLYKGQFIKEIMRRERFIEDEIRAAVREAGHGNLDDIYAVVLETDGSLSVLANMDDVDESGSLANVTNREDIGIGGK